MAAYAKSPWTQFARGLHAHNADVEGLAGALFACLETRGMVETQVISMMPKRAQFV